MKAEINLGNLLGFGFGDIGGDISTGNLPWSCLVDRTGDIDKDTYIGV